ncbi:MAG: hypothetical protein AAGF26_14000 [Cyanobacteria bacterium P01_G01_bin.49]
MGGNKTTSVREIPWYPNKDFSQMQQKLKAIASDNIPNQIGDRILPLKIINIQPTLRS